MRFIIRGNPQGAGWPALIGRGAKRRSCRAFVDARNRWRRRLVLIETGMDVLADALQTVRVRSAESIRVEAAGPWGIGARSGLCGCFYVVLEGSVWFRCPALPEPVKLAVGDVVVVPCGDRHELSSRKNSSDAVLFPWEGREAEGPLLRIDGSDPRCVFLGVRLELEGHRASPIIAGLPRVFLVKDEPGGSGHGIEPALRILSSEVERAPPGARTVISRIAEVILIQIIRSHWAADPGGASGFLAALSDTQIGAALALIHANPERGWTVQGLAHQVAMSRSVFAARFTRLVGEPPLSYVTRWRMQKAAGLLREKDLTIAEVAESVGYDSEAAFSKAFKRSLGMAPGAYRRHARASGFPVAA